MISLFYSLLQADTDKKLQMFFLWTSHTNTCHDTFTMSAGQNRISICPKDQVIFPNSQLIQIKSSRCYIDHSHRHKPLHKNSE